MRAVTQAQKEAIIGRIIEVWMCGNNKYLRLGQLIANATHCSDLFYIDDTQLADAVESFAARSEGEL